MFPLPEQGSAGLENFFRYVTSLDKVPPLGLSRKVEVEFSNNSNQAYFAETCSTVLKVPTLHGSLEDFQETFLEACDRPLVFSRNGCHYQ